MCSCLERIRDGDAAVSRARSTYWCARPRPRWSQEDGGWRVGLGTSGARPPARHAWAAAVAAVTKEAVPKPSRQRCAEAVAGDIILRHQQILRCTQHEIMVTIISIHPATPQGATKLTPTSRGRRPHGCNRAIVIEERSRCNPEARSCAQPACCLYQQGPPSKPSLQNG